METGRPWQTQHLAAGNGQRARCLWISGRVRGVVNLSTDTTAAPALRRGGNTRSEATSHVSVTLPIDASREHEPIRPVRSAGIAASWWGSVSRECASHGAVRPANGRSRHLELTLGRCYNVAARRQPGGASQSTRATVRPRMRWNHDWSLGDRRAVAKRTITG